MRAAIRASIAFALSACGGSTYTLEHVPPYDLEDAGPLDAAVASDGAIAWTGYTASHVAIEPRDLSAREAALLDACGEGEAGLTKVAAEIVERRRRGAPPMDLDALAFAQRAAGEPHVWPHTFVVTGHLLDPEVTRAKLFEWRRSFHAVGRARCGVAIARDAGGDDVIAVVALDALADLAPLPIRTHVGTWLTVDAHLLVPAAGAHAILVGPSGAPRVLPTVFEPGHARARFALDRPGAFTLQLVADVATGPRPVLEAQLYADVPPPTSPPDLAVPGEQIALDDAPPDDALTRLVQSLRASEQLPPVHRDARLDAIARVHSSRMLQARTVGHDVGDGDPSERFAEGNLRVTESGENVAHAPTLALAHRALYASPSHRANLLRPEFTSIGIAVLRDSDGSVWITEEFASGLR